MTPNNHDDLTDDLGRALHHRADGLVGSPITLGDVKGRASRIRRRRAMAASAAVAAAVAIIVPTAITGSDLFQDSSEPGPAGPSPTGTETPTGPPNTESWPQRLDTLGLPAGEAPHVTWREGSTLHTADGDVPIAESYFQIVRYDDGWLALGSDNDGTLAFQLDADGAVIDTSRTSDSLAESADGGQVLWVDDGALTIHDNGTGEDTVIGEGHEGTDPVAIVDGTAYYNVATEGWQRDGRWWRDGEEKDPVPGDPQPYKDVSVDGVTTAVSSVDDFGSCSTLRSPHGNALGETCDFTLLEFSPDGAHLAAGPSYQDGFADSELAVLPVLDGGITKRAVVLHYQRKSDADPFFVDSTWEDATHLLTVTFTPTPGSAQGTWQILRLGLDGTVENAVEPVPGTDARFPFGVS